MKNLILVLSICLFSSASWSKRMAPAKIKPIVSQGREFSFQVEQSPCKNGENCGMQVFLVSKNIASGRINWKRELYQKLFNPNLEIDMQTVFLRSLELSKQQLIAIDERGSKYIVKSQTGDLVQPLKSIIYSANKSLNTR